MWLEHMLLLEESVCWATHQLLAVSQFAGSEEKGAVSSKMCSLKNPSIPTNTQTLVTLRRKGKLRGLCILPYGRRQHQ